MSADETWEEHLARYREADALYKKGKLKSALNCFRKALALAPGDSDTLWALGDCHSELGQPRKAERFYRLARLQAPWDERGDLLYNIANALLDQGRPRAALQLYARVPRSAAAFLLAQRNSRLATRKLANISFQPTAFGGG